MRVDGRRWLVAAAVLAVAAGCGRCGARRAAAPERHLPPDAAAVIVPRLGAAAEHLAALSKTLGQFPIAASVGERRGALAGQLGFDLLDPKGLESAGLDPDGGAAFARTPAGPLALLPVGDAARLGALLERLARDQLGAGLREVAKVEGQEVTVVRSAAGRPPALAWAMAGGVAAVAPGDGGAALAARAVALAEPASLAATPAWKTAREALPGKPDLVAFAPAGAWPSTALAPLRDGAALAIVARETSLELTGAVLLPPPRLEAWRAVAGAAKAGELARLPKDAFLAGRFGGDPAVLVQRLAWLLPDGAKARLAGAGVDLERDVAALLAPGAAASISLAPTFDFTAFSRGRVPAVAQDPFRFVHVAAVVRAKDEAAAKALVGLVARAAPALELSAATGDGEVTLARGPAALRLVASGADLFVAGGDGRVDELRRGGGLELPSAARDVAGGGFASAAALPGALLRAARGLPEAAFGQGPDRFVMRSIADRVLDPAARLEAAALRVEVAEGAARLVLRVDARPGGAAAP